MLDFRGLVHQALAALEQDRPADAEKALRAALGMNPRDDQLLHLLGVALVQQQREEEAIGPLQKAISLNRRAADYHNALGCALRNSARYAEGLESFQRALKLDPGLQDVHYNLGQTYQRMGEFAMAEEKFQFIRARNPGDVEVIGALSNMRWFMGDYEAAIGVLRAGIQAHPASGDMRFLLGQQLLALGRFEEGWFRYLWRVNRHVFLRSLGLPFDSPELMSLFPASLEGLTVRVHAEQGIGDDLYFLRFTQQLRERGARVVGAMTPRLLEMIRRSGALDECEPALARIPPSPEHRLLADLPYLLRSHERPIPEALRFAPLPAQSAEITSRLLLLKRPLIGLTWRAGTSPEAGNRNALFKEIPFGAILELARVLPGTLLVLQRQPKAGELQKLAEACGARLVDLSALNDDLESMLALLAQIDEYIGVSNTNMHLCAALGHSARVLVSRGVEFRWMAEGESPWFPGFPVYRQGEKSDWDAALKALAEDVGGDFSDK